MQWQGVGTGVIQDHGDTLWVCARGHRLEVGLPIRDARVESVNDEAMAVLTTGGLSSSGVTGLEGRSTLQAGHIQALIPADALRAAKLGVGSHDQSSCFLQLRTAHRQYPG